MRGFGHELGRWKCSPSPRCPLPMTHRSAGKSVRAWGPTHVSANFEAPGPQCRLGFLPVTRLPAVEKEGSGTGCRVLLQGKEMTEQRSPVTATQTPEAYQTAQVMYLQRRLPPLAHRRACKQISNIRYAANVPRVMWKAKPSKCSSMHQCTSTANSPRTASRGSLSRSVWFHISMHVSLTDSLRNSLVPPKPTAPPCARVVLWETVLDAHVLVAGGAQIVVDRCKTLLAARNRAARRFLRDFRARLDVPSQDFVTILTRFDTQALGTALAGYEQYLTSRGAGALTCMILRASASGRHTENILAVIAISQLHA